MARSGRSALPKFVEENYSVENELAKGKFGVVYKCQENVSKADVAVKIMLSRHNKREDVEREVTILKQVDHPGILCFTDFKEDNGTYILITELLTGGELFDYCTSKDYLIEGEAIFFMKQMLSALEYLHAKKICHLDLKPENIVLKDESSKNIKIIDFGTARDLSTSNDVKVMVGTPEFIAPEVLNYDPVSCNSDMWAIGAITFCLLTGCSPFLGDNDIETIQFVTQGEFEFPEPEDDDGYEDISDSAKDFITNLLVMNPRKRMSSSQALQHKWISALSYRQSRISTDRLKKLRRRRKLLAAMQAVRLSVGLYRAFSRTSSVSTSQSSKPPQSSGARNGSIPTDKTFSLPKHMKGPLSEY